MTLLDACASFCVAAQSVLGPTLGETVFYVLGLALVWWRARVHVGKVLAPVVARADAAEKKAADAHMQLAEIKGSLRPSVGYVAPLIGTSSSQSGNFEPIVMPELGAGTPRPRPSMADPSLTGEAPLPRPSNLPSFGEARKTPLPGKR